MRELLPLRLAGRSTARESGRKYELGDYSGEERIMLWAIAAILLVCWFLGMVTFHALGMYVHILLVLAIIAILIRIIQGRSPL
jgi:hypothetical protein